MSETIFTSENMTVRIGNRPIVDHVSFALRKGEMVALVGPNGAGKTTLLRAMAGIETSRGKVMLGETPSAAMTAGERARKIGYMPQGHVFHWPMPAKAVVALGRLPHSDYFSRLNQADEAAIAKAIAATGIQDQARVALARVLATQAAIILADEPTVSLDPKHQLVVMNLLRQAARDGGAVLAVVHDLTLAARFCDRVLVMENGKLVADAAPEQALSPERLSAVFGVDAVMIDTGEGRVPIVRHAL